MTKKVHTGRDSVVIGNVSGDVGDGSVVIGPTDDKGNVIINQPMAVGHGASAGPGSIAIGAGASAGSNILHLIHQLRCLPDIQSDKALLSTIDALQNEIASGNPDKSKVATLWGIIQTASTIGGAVGLIQQIGQALVL